MLRSERMLAAVVSGDLLAVQQISEEYRSLPMSAVDLSEPLCLAIQNEHCDIVETLIRHRADVNHELRDGRRPIHLAAEVGNVAILRMIIRAGSPVNTVDGCGVSALHTCLERGYHDASRLLIEDGAMVNRPRRYDTGEGPMHCAARHGMTDALRLIIRKGGYLEQRSKDSSTALHVAVREKHIGCVNVLCQSGASLNVTDSKGMTPLTIASQQFALSTVRTLLKYDVDVNFTNNDGLGALHYISSFFPPSQTQAEIVGLLLSAGVDVRKSDNQGRTALHLAAACGNAELCRILVNHGADINAKERVIGETALNTAAGYDRRDVVRCLAECGADVNIPDRHLVAPLQKLLSTRGVNKYEATDVLLRHGALVNQSDDRGSTPLEQCVFRSVVSRMGRDGLCVLRRLAASGAVLKAASTQRSIRNSPLCWLTWHGELEAASFLVNAGWELHGEQWISLPGKDPDMEEFLARLRHLVHEPISLRASCRRTIRLYSSAVCADRDIVPLLESLPVPTIIKRYLTFQTETDDI